MRARVKCWLLALFLAGCGGGGAEERVLLVYSGAANQPAMEKIAARYRELTGIKVNLVSGGSGTLLSQIEISGRGDVYLPGSPDYIVIGERKKLLVPGSERIVAYLVPAIVVPAGNPAGIENLENLVRPGIRVGMGNPETVCLGLYWVELLEENRLLEEVLKNTVTMAESCAATANLAALGRVDAVLGWRVFHYWNPGRMDFVPLKPDRIPRISYIPITVVASTEQPREAEAFIEFVLSEAGRAVYAELGYLAAEKAAREFAPRAGIGGEYRLPESYFRLIRSGVLR